MSATKSNAGHSSPKIWIQGVMPAFIASAYALMELNSLELRGSTARLNMALLSYLTGLMAYAQQILIGPEANGKNPAPAHLGHY